MFVVKYKITLGLIEELSKLIFSKGNVTPFVIFDVSYGNFHSRNGIICLLFNYPDFCVLSVLRHLNKAQLRWLDCRILESAEIEFILFLHWENKEDECQNKCNRKDLLPVIFKKKSNIGHQSPHRIARIAESLIPLFFSSSILDRS